MIWAVGKCADAAVPRNWGRLLAAYMMVHYGRNRAWAINGQQPPTDLMSVLPCNGMVLAAILLLLFTRIVNQNSEHQEATPRLADETATGAFGRERLHHLRIVLGSLYGLMPPT